MIGVVAQDDANLYGLMFLVASRKKLPDEYGDIALFRVSPLQPCINGLHKMETEGHEESKHGFSDEFCQRYCRFSKFD